MRILYLSHYALPHLGGIEVAVDALAREMLGRGHEVVHVAADAGGIGEPRPGGPRVVRVPAWNGPEDRLGVPTPVFRRGALREAIGAELEGADVVHAHGFLYSPSSVGLGMAERRDIGARVLTEHVGHVPYSSAILDRVEAGAIRTLGARTARRARAIVVLNEKVDSEMAALVPEVPRRTIPNGVDLERYRPPEAGERDRLRSELGWDDAPRALFAGRLVAKKGLGAALGAAALRPDAFRLAVAGRGEPPPGASDSAEILGEVAPDRLAELYRAADALVLPSRGEGFPLTIQEAMASGLPVVVADDPSYGPYLDGAGEGARRVAPEPEPLAEALAGLLGDEDARRSAGERAREHAERSFSWTRAADEHERLYRELAAGGS